MFTRLVLVALSLQCVASYPMYQTRIPNGASVPFPCKPGEIWQGVGHILNQGSGDRNNFGLDFAAANHMWTKDLCMKDSDGDGMSNGEELGDPDCEWKENAVPKRSTGLSHPGVCDIWDSTNCMKQTLLKSTKYPTQKEWMADMCKSGGLDCPAMNETDTITLDLHFPNGTKVPSQETTYECYIYNLTEEGVDPSRDFHMVAVTPIIDNSHILHHMVLFGCTDDTPTSSAPFECGMVAATTCQDFLHVWTVGLAGECYHPMSGIRFGPTGYKIVAIQLHWNNAAHRSDYTDSSGFQIYYTPHLRPYDAGVFVTGDVDFILPPKRDDLMVTSLCSGSCTKMILTGSVNVTSAWNHMHYAGNKMDIQVYRNGSFLQYLTEDKVYSYDSPQVFLYPDPFVLEPGDSIITTCGYNTMKRNETTIWGEATINEMCFGFFTVYPKQNMRQTYCVTSMGVSWCEPDTLEGCTHLDDFVRVLNTTDVYRNVAANCRMFSPCLQECIDTVVYYMQTDKCMQGNIWKFIQAQLNTSNTAAREFMSRLASCQVEVYQALQPTDTSSSSTQQPAGTTQQLSNYTQQPADYTQQSSYSTQPISCTTPKTAPVVEKNDDGDSALRTTATTPLVFLSLCVLAAHLWS